MKLLIDGRTVRPGQTGVGYYTEEFVRALAAFPGSPELHVLTLHPEAWDGVAGVNIRAVKVDYESHPAGDWFMQSNVPRLLGEGDFDAFWGPAFHVPWRTTRAARIVTIHDLTAFSMRQAYPWRFAAYMRFITRRALGADCIVCPSTTVAQELRSRFGLPRARVVAVHSGVSRFFSPGDEASLVPQPYVLAVGAGNPRKNDEFLLRVWDSVRGNEPHSLVLVGQTADNDAGRRVICVGRQSREELRRLYRNASLLLFPSLYEGFGLPMLEAMACGCPVVASNAGALPEVGGDAAAYLDPRDETNAVAVVKSLLGDSSTLGTMREKGLARAASFSWERAAGEMIAVMTHSVAVRHA